MYPKLNILLPLLFLSIGAIIPTSILKANAREIPEPECKSASMGDDSACGYHCKDSGDGRKVACAEWPGGKCESDWRTVSCGPPAPENWARDYRRGNINTDWRDNDDKDKLRKRRRELLQELERIEEKLNDD